MGKLVRKTDKKRTKIVATIGPSSSQESVLREMIRAGMDVARINFSHGDHEMHARNIALIRRIAAEENAVVAIMGDLQGPKIRLGKVIGEPVPLRVGDRLTLTTRLNPAETAELSEAAKQHVYPLPHAEFVRDVRAGQRLLVDDGTIEFKVLTATSTDLHCEVIVEGALQSRKGVSAPESRLTLSALTEKDREDVKFALEHKLDYIAMSFVRSSKDIDELRWLCRYLNADDVAIIAKIEKSEALQAFDEILRVSDGIMVARGDLGVETPAEEVPIRQKEIIRRCNEVGKPVITATQMLQSMIDNPRPTRAEASDVANAIFDGSDAVMLSGETASGKFPVLAVETMANIAVIAEQNFDRVARTDRVERALLALGEARQVANMTGEGFAVATSRTASVLADLLNARAIVTTTWTGSTARQVARTRPKTPILCVTPNETTLQRMALVWGVIPIYVPEFSTIDEMVQTVVRACYDQELVEFGDVLVLIAGMPFGAGSQANFIKIHRVGEHGEVPQTRIAAAAASAKFS
ncbi:MAG: pyruvate kinase [Candidatus Thermofonsia Clade 1 bacterium]|uniref:Pyruvate kinase n=1 Tax=Candidatus Thermofonsia Clade 1 bacterium TaxID=2364210 RepID=A0A2M8PC90_9CHLR|nr:MAG: pyruvate kinase [Candidatus Thermofonsia Clade 1 bacterium]RMF52276.1 MAG: pyruvate kinase [Chloroflexota bacterium]